MGLGSTGNRPCGIPHKVRVGAGGFGNGRESDIYNSIRESEVRGALEKYVGGDASICNSLCGRGLFGLAGSIRHDGVSPVGTTRKTPATLLGLRAARKPVIGDAAHHRRL
jgi:hypothetical protein